MFLWALSLAALGAAVVVGAYSYIRLKPTILIVRDRVLKLEAEVSRLSHRTPEKPDDSWRMDERRLSKAIDRLQAKHRKMSRDFSKIEEGFSEQSGRLTKLSPKLKSMENSVKDYHDSTKQQLVAVEGLVSHLPNANELNWSPHARMLTSEAIGRITGELAGKLDLQITPRQLGSLSHAICAVESTSHGRLATTVDAMMVRVLAAIHLARAGQKLRLVEIGTLYGVGAIAIADSVKFIIDDLSITLIDPLDGFYAKDNADYVSTKPVIRSVLDENLKRAFLGDNQVTIVQAKSESEEALAQASKSEIDMLIIDGDHSRAGVKRDFENYCNMVRSGGLIVVDDYGVEEWPDIKRYADEEVLVREDFEEVFAGFRTLLLRKK